MTRIRTPDLPHARRTSLPSVLPAAAVNKNMTDRLIDVTLFNMYVPFRISFSKTRHYCKAPGTFLALSAIERIAGMGHFRATPANDPYLDLGLHGLLRTFAPIIHLWRQARGNMSNYLVLILLHPDSLAETIAWRRTAMASTRSFGAKCLTRNIKSTIYPKTSIVQKKSKNVTVSVVFTPVTCESNVFQRKFDSYVWLN